MKALFLSIFAFVSVSAAAADKEPVSLGWDTSRLVLAFAQPEIAAHLSAIEQKYMTSAGEVTKQEFDVVADKDGVETQKTVYVINIDLMEADDIMCGNAKITVTITAHWIFGFNPSYSYAAVSEADDSHCSF